MTAPLSGVWKSGTCTTPDYQTTHNAQCTAGLGGCISKVTRYSSQSTSSPASPPLHNLNSPRAVSFPSLLLSERARLPRFYTSPRAAFALSRARTQCACAPNSNVVDVRRPSVSRHSRSRSNRTVNPLNAQKPQQTCSQKPRACIYAICESEKKRDLYIS